MMMLSVLLLVFIEGLREGGYRIGRHPGERFCRIGREELYRLCRRMSFWFELLDSRGCSEGI